MSVHVIYYKDGAKMMRPVLTREEYISLRDSEANRAYTQILTKPDATPQQRDAAKRRLVQMNYSCLPGLQTSLQTSPYPLAPPPIGGGGEYMPCEGPLKGATQASNTVGMDIDYTAPNDSPKEEGEAAELLEAWMQMVKDRVLAKKEELGLLMLERSATKGYHLVFSRRPDLNQEENLRWASDLLGVAYDKGAKDITRVFFTTTSDRIVYLDERVFEQTLPKGEGADESEILEIPESPGSPREGKAPPKGEGSAGSSGSPSYLGIPYPRIIAKYWEMFYGGATPVKSNRDTLTYELANVMKHICGFDRTLLQQVIPCYDGFPEAEKLKCIDSALSGKRTQMPKRLRDVLEALRRTQLVTKQDTEAVAAFDEALAQDELFYYNRIPKGVLVQGVKDSIDAAGETLAMPIITAICPAIGARATGVMLDVHGKVNTLNLISYISGDFASGKGQMDDVVYAWMSEDRVMAALYDQQWREWRDKYKQKRNSKELPPEPKLPKKWLTLNNTTANLAEELSNVQGQHAFSFTPEADVVSMKWKSSVGDFSTMIRQSYDASGYDREARSVDAVNVHIDKLLWNVVMCGTPDALYRVVSNYTDGFQSRIAVARTPDNTFAALDDHPAHLTDLQKERIEQVSHLLPLLNGRIVLSKLEKRGREWLEEIRMEAMKNHDMVMARQRFRICVTAQRMTCCLMLVAVCSKLIKEHGVSGAEMALRRDPTLWVKMTERMQTPAFMEMYGLIADSLIDNALYFFRDRIEDAFNARSYAGSTKQLGTRSRKGKNDSIYSRLPQEFSFAEAVQISVAVKGVDVSQNNVRQMLKNWENQGLVETMGEGRYKKGEAPL